MTRRAPGKQKKPTLMGSHQRCWIWGRQAVMETLRAGRWRPLEVRLDERLPDKDRDEVVRRAERLEVAISFAPAGELERACRSAEHQGFLAKMPPYPYERAEDVLAAASARPFYVVLDAVQDPFNFGAMLRSADVFGVEGVFVGATKQAEVSSLVVRASSGAVNHVRLAQVDEIGDLIARLKSIGITVLGTSPGAKRDVSQVDLRRPTALVLGNEAVGIRPEILDLCDERIAIRQRGHVGSLNAAVAAGILFYEVSRQRGTK
jgi:23S rRNA (guanosine2251-2'-O)-methyltransferase